MTGTPQPPRRWDARLASRWETRVAGRSRKPGGDRDHAEALAAARDLPDSAARLVELERIASSAEATGDLRTGLDARFALIDAYLRQGERWLLFEPVRRCRELLAAIGEPAGERGVALRRYQRFAVEAVFATPRVGLDQARTALDDLASTTPGDPASTTPGDPARTTPGDPAGHADPAGDPGDPSDLVAELRCRLADHLGDEPAARRWYDRWRTAPPDPAAGCPGCAPSRRAELLAGWGDWASALAELRPYLRGRAGPAHCTDQPERALADALLPLLRAGEPERAVRAHVEAYRRHRGERAAFPHLAAHLRFCALGGYLDRGLDILAEQLPRLGHPADDLATMEFAAAGALLCALATEAGRGDRRMPAPTATDGTHSGPHGGAATDGTHSGSDGGAAGGPDGAAGSDGEAAGGPDGGIEVARLGGLLAELATTLAGSFDARNGTGHQSGRIAARLAERPVAAPVPLPAAEAGPDGDAADPTAAPDRRPAEDGPIQDEPVGDRPAEDGPTEDGPADGRGNVDELAEDELGALTVGMLTAALDRRGDTWAMRGGAVVGRWGPAVIEFRRAGERGEILHVRVLAVRRVPTDRRSEAYEFCNAWNHDRLQPKAYAHDDGDGELVLAGDLTTDLAHGVAPGQLDVLVTAAVTTGVAYAEAVAALP